MGVAVVVEAQEASCKGGRHSEPTSGTLLRGHLRSREGEAVES